MKISISRYRILLVTLLIISFVSCKKKEDPYADVKGSYFSIKQFGLDAWNTYSGQPIMIMKTTRVDKGKTDSTLTNSDVLQWAPIFKTFFETDISDHKYLGQYDFTQFNDTKDGTLNWFYEAKDKDLFTQKLLLTLDLFTNKVRGIYIETYKKDIGGDHIQKLYYNPMKTIQIQTDTKTLAGTKKYTLEQYDFVW